MIGPAYWRVKDRAAPFDEVAPYCDGTDPAAIVGREGSSRTAGDSPPNTPEASW
jgi:hypothetical protein